MSLIEENRAAPTQLPLLPLRDVVVFPHMVIPLFVGRPKSIKALEAAMESGKSIVLVAQKSAAKDPMSPRRYRRTRPPRRHDGRAPAAQARAEAGSARDVRSEAAPRAP